MKNLQVYRKKMLSWWQNIRFKAKHLNNFQIYQETRTRILLWYLILMGLFIAIAIPTIRYRLIAEVTARVERDMREQLEEFEEELIEILLESSLNPDPELAASERINKRINSAFDNFISTNQGEDDNYFIAFIGDSFHKTNASFLPEEIAPNSAIMQDWQELTVEKEGEIKVDDPNIGSILYKAEPIKTTKEVIGVFVVVHLSAGERQEVLSSFNTVVQVLLLIILLASGIAWVAAGKILAPLHNFSDTLKSISESDLSQRIQVQGQGELAQLGRTFNAMMERIEDSFDTQRNFINDAGHELKTPITIIRGHLELMDIDTPEQQETVNLTIDELDRMNRLVEDLVLLAKAERPDFLQIETIELTTFITEMFGKMQTLGERNWHLDSQILSGKMTGDHQRITQAIINLASNAVQHTIVDSLIVFGSKIKGDRVEFWLRDTGNGIAAKEQERIFARFARVKNTRRRSEGTGLGLAIVKAVVEAHQGEINLQSKLGIGSTFTLVFPLEFNEKQKP
ncbi:MAG: ATP-binding protein [Cyanobacteria bacterium P01_A01_bin.83]